MSGDILGAAVLPGLVVAIAAGYGYGAYWAFRVRQALFDRLYRSRAEWVGIVGVFISILALSYLLIGTLGSDNFYLSVVQYTVTDMAGIVTFAWVDTTIRAARKFDPLRRNTLRWSRVRWFLWFFVIISSVGGLGSAILTGETYFSPAGGRSALIQGPFGFSTIGLIAVLLARRRVADASVREHLKWLALYLVTILAADQVTASQYLASLDALRTVAAGALAVGAYFLYRSAKSAAPVNKLPLQTFGLGRFDDASSSVEPNRPGASTEREAASPPS